MKTANLKVLLAAALTAGAGAFALADDTGGEELIASGEASLWLAPDEFVEAFGEASLWLGPDEILEASDETTFALLASLLPELPANPTDEQIRTAIDTVCPVDRARILALIRGTGNFSYQAFREWAMNLGLSKVAGSEHAGDSFAFGVAELFENKPEVEITSADVGSNASGEAEMVVSVTVKDGGVEKPVSAAKVKEMFEATSDLADWDDKKLSPTVTVRTEGTVATPVEFTVKPGDGKAPSAYLRLRK